MDPVGILFILIFIVIGISRFIAFVAKNAPKNQGSRPTDRDGNYVAPQNAVRDFLRNLQQAHQASDPDIVVLDAARSGESTLTGDPDIVVLPNEESEHDEECHDPLPSETRSAASPPPPVRLSRAAVRTDRPRRRRKSRKAPEPRSRISAAAPAPQTVQRKAPRPVMGSGDLRQAVIWSEILGPPVSLRRRGERGYSAQRQ